MRAALYKGSKTIETGTLSPVKPGPGQVRVAVAYCGVCGTDVHIYHGKMDQRVTTPLPIGHEMSGRVEEVGEGVTNVSPGDRVVVRPLDPCDACPACQAGHNHICQNLKFMGIDTHGAFQESWTVPAHTLHHLPDGVTYQTGALIEPLAVACHVMARGELKPGAHAVVIGAGPIGMLVAMTAKQRGAHVIVSEVNKGRLAMAEKLGLDSFDPTTGDLPALIEERTGGAGADVVFEVSGSKAGAEMMTKLPRTRGRIVMVAVVPDPLPVDLFRFFWRELELHGARVYEPNDFEEAIKLAASNELPLDELISKVYPLEKLGAAFDEISAGADVMKVLVQCDEKLK